MQRVDLGRGEVLRLGSRGCIGRKVGFHRSGTSSSWRCGATLGRRPGLRPQRLQIFPPETVFCDSLVNICLTDGGDVSGGVGVMTVVVVTVVMEDFEDWSDVDAVTTELPSFLNYRYRVCFYFHFCFYFGRINHDNCKGC